MRAGTQVRAGAGSTSAETTLSARAGHGVAAEQAHVLAVEVQFLHRPVDGGIARRAFYIGKNIVAAKLAPFW
jgi:hypothetical protein